MRAHTFVRDHPPYKRDTGGDESPHTWKAIVFLSLSAFDRFSTQVPTGCAAFHLRLVVSADTRKRGATERAFLSR